VGADFLLKFYYRTRRKRNGGSKDSGRTSGNGRTGNRGQRLGRSTPGNDQRLCRMHRRQAVDPRGRGKGRNWTLRDNDCPRISDPEYDSGLWCLDDCYAGGHNHGYQLRPGQGQIHKPSQGRLQSQGQDGADGYNSQRRQTNHESQIHRGDRRRS